MTQENFGLAVWNVATCRVVSCPVGIVLCVVGWKKTNA